MRAKYGGVLVKKTEANGDLRIDVVLWLNAITDQVDVRNGVKIERHYYPRSSSQRKCRKLEEHQGGH
jgi:hypothetical protein